MIFLAGKGEKQTVTLGPYVSEITCYKYHVGKKDAVGSTFPGTAPLNANQAATKVQAAFRGMDVRRLYNGKK